MLSSYVCAWHTVCMGCRSGRDSSRDPCVSPKPWGESGLVLICSAQSRCHSPVVQLAADAPSNCLSWETQVGIPKFCPCFCPQLAVGPWRPRFSYLNNGEKAQLLLRKIVMLVWHNCSYPFWVIGWGKGILDCVPLSAHLFSVFSSLGVPCYLPFSFFICWDVGVWRNSEWRSGCTVQWGLWCAFVLLNP